MNDPQPGNPGMRALTIILAVAILAACAAPKKYTGYVSSKAYADVEPNASFAIVSPNSGSMAEVEVENLITEAMTARGFTRAADIDTADIAVIYSISTDSGRGSGNSTAQSGRDGEQVGSPAQHNRHMQVLLYKVSDFDDFDGATIVWQAEITGVDSSTDDVQTGEFFVGTLFENFGKTKSKDSFHRIVVD